MSGFKLAEIFRLLTLTVLTTAQLACTSHKDNNSKVNDLVFDQRASNVALLFGSAGGLAGVPTDLREMRALLENPANGFGFKVVVVEEASAEQMTQVTQQYAAQVGERGTMLWYYSGHGASGDGCMATTSECITFAPIAQAIQRARATPMKRFFFFSDSCFSGQMVNGSSAILPGGSGGSFLSLDGTPAPYSIRNPGINAYTNKAADSVNNALWGIQNQNLATRATGVFEQALTMSAARGDETSADLGSESGGAFTYSLRRTLASLKGNPAATIRDMVNQSTRLTQNEFGHTPAYRSIPGDVMLNDRLFGGDQGSTQGGGTSVPVPNLFVKAGPSADGGSARLYVSAPAGVAKVSICRGPLAQCRTTPTESVAFVPLERQPLPDRVMFRSATAVPLVNGESFLVYGVTAQGQIALGQGILSRQR